MYDIQRSAGRVGITTFMGEIRQSLGRDPSNSTFQTRPAGTTIASSMLMPSSPPPSVSSYIQGQTNPHFAAVGGETGVGALVDRFYHYMSTRPEAATIRAMHPSDLTPVKAVFQRFLIEWLGGPALYAQEPGRPRLRKKHLRFNIGVTERDVWMRCMELALADVVPDEPLQKSLKASFARAAEFMRNDAGHVHHEDPSRGTTTGHEMAPSVTCAVCGAESAIPLACIGTPRACPACGETLHIASPIAIDRAEHLKLLITTAKIPVVVDFWAAWCEPCKALAPHITALAKARAGEWLIVKADTEVDRRMGLAFTIMSVPLIVVFEGGKELDRRGGATSAADVTRIVKKALGLHQG